MQRSGAASKAVGITGQVTGPRGPTTCRLAGYLAGLPVLFARGAGVDSGRVVLADAS